LAEVWIVYLGAPDGSIRGKAVNNEVFNLVGMDNVTRNICISITDSVSILQIIIENNPVGEFS
jgi:hypothetical protein